MIKVGSDFSGVGAFNQALIRLGVEYKEVFACDMDKYARQTFIHNYGEPKYYPTNVYNREIPAKPLDIYMTSPPCQAFSLAGKRLGKDDKRGILFFNSHEFIKKNKPRYFIFENVKGLLSDDNGNTFQEWVNMLGGKSVNGAPVLFPYDDAVPYHLYWKVLNAKNHGVPQNRERVFLIGIRDDADNTFRWPIEERLEKRLKDVLEDYVDDKYFLSDKMIKCIMKPASEKWQSGKMEIDLEIARPITATCHKMHRADTDNYIQVKVDKIGYINQDTQASQIYSDEGISQTMTAGTHGYAMGYAQVKSATSKVYEEATEGDSINFTVPNSQTRRGRVGKQVAQTLDTACNQGVIQINPSKESGGVQPYQQNRVYDSNGLCPALNAGQSGWGGNIVTLPNNYQKNGIICGAIRGRGENNEQTLELNNSDCTNSITTVQKDNILTDGYSIRRLTPRECFRLMDFPDTFTWPVSDSQAYKQAGNSIVVNVLYKILKNLNL
jgi:DNA (cytosine-5)-methyltransferase 1